jgi:methylated-DNA-[protein]-cysteine S-methyltransferase
MNDQSSELYTVCYSPVDTSLLGRIWIAARGSGICFLDFSESEAEFTNGLFAVLSHFPGEAEIRLDPTNLSKYLETLIAYFDERTPIPDDLPTQIGFLTEFQCEVLKIVKGIPMGSVLTYGELARQLGKPQAARAVGQVLRANPLPVIIPCHRVVRSDGSVGGYGGILGSERKIALLKHEGVILA